MSAVAGGGGGGGPVLPNAAFVANSVVSSQTSPYPLLSDVSVFTVEFRDTSGGSPTAWAWDFGDGATSTDQDPLNHNFECLTAGPCSYHVSMVATNVNGSSTAFMDVTVLPLTGVDFSANKTLISPGTAVTFTDASTSGGTDYAWDFGDGTSTNGTNTTPTHTYGGTGVFTVSLTVTYDVTGPVTVTKDDYIRVETGLCTVPDLNGKRFNDATGIFQGTPYDFTGVVERDTGAPNGNFIITAQDLTATSLAPCVSNIKVAAP